MRRPYVHTEIKPEEFAGLATADQRLNCFMVYQKDSTFGIGLGLKNLLGFNTSSSKSSGKFVFGVNGSVEELRSPDDFFEKVILTSTDACSWLRSRLAILRKLQITMNLFEPSLWLLTGLYKIADATYYSISKVNSSIGVDGNVPIVDPTGLAALLQLNVGGEIKLESGVTIDAGAKINGIKVWAAQWQKVDAKYVAASKWNEGIKNQLRLLDIHSTARGKSDTAGVAELSLGGDTTVPPKDATDNEEEYWDAFEKALKDAKWELPQQFPRSATSDATPKRFALLIGVDFYMPGTARPSMTFPNLQGCVEDVKLVEQYLRTRHHLDDEHIEVLTAPCPKDSQIPQKYSSKLPTCKNILEAFAKITEAPKGSFVYIHYSGHGARAATIFDDSIHLKPKGDFDEVLVPTDIAQEKGRYIRDVEIAYLLQEMVDKGLYVSVVFDCCHSGGVNRGRTSRGVKLDENRLESDTPLISPEKLVDAWSNVQSKRTRGGEVKHWLLDPDGYAFLAACLDSQEAHEHLFGDKVRGVLTHLLIEVLERYKDSPMKPTYDMLHSYIRETMKNYSSQIPVVGGEGDRSFFAKERLLPFYTATLSDVPEDPRVGSIVKLNCGRAHGISEGAEFAVWAMTGFFMDSSGTLMADVSNSYEPLARLKIKNLHGVTSEATLYEIGQVPVYTGSQAVKTTNGVLVLVHLMPSVTIDQRKALDEALSNPKMALKRFLRLILSDEQNDKPSFKVEVNGSRYEIRKVPEDLILPMPGLHIDAEGACEKLLHRLAHLTNYFNVRDIINHEYTLPFSVKVAGKLMVTTAKPKVRRRHLSESSNISVENVIPVGDVYEVVDGDYIILLIENFGESRIYVTLLNLSSTWSVTKLFPRGSTAFEPIERDMALEIPIKMSKEKAPYGNLDIFKSYVSMVPTSFHSLLLPTIDENLSLTQLDAVKNPNLKIKAKKDRKTRVGNVPSSSEDEALPVARIWDTKKVMVRTL